MELEQLIFNNNGIEVTPDKRERLEVKGAAAAGEEHRFDIESSLNPKNLVISMAIMSRSKVDPGQINFYFRYVDSDNYCIFSIREGREIAFKVIGKGKVVLSTSWLNIAKESLYKKNFNFILAAFEDTTTVLIDETVVLNIEHTPEVEGKVGIEFISAPGSELDCVLDKFSISDNVINLQPILELPKRPDVYFMHGSDFYEQNRYELSLTYYRKGMLFGRSDDKINNRVGNLFFLIEEFKSAETFYKLAYDAVPDNIDYKINYVRSLIRQRKEAEFEPLFKELIAKEVVDKELYIDYAGYLIDRALYSEARIYLIKIEDEAKDEFSYLAKAGRCLVELGELNRGVELLCKAAELQKDKDPASSVIILKFALARKTDAACLKLLSQLLIWVGEYKEVYEIIMKTRWDIPFDQELLVYLVTAELELDLDQQAFDEFERFAGEELIPGAGYVKAKAMTRLGMFEEALAELETLSRRIDLEKGELEGVTVNEIIYLDLYIYSNGNREFLTSKEGQEFIGSLVEMARPDQPLFKEIRKEYAMMLVDGGRHNEAIPILKELLSGEESKLELYYNLGLAYYGLEDYLSARDNLLKVYKENSSREVVFAYANTLFYCKSYHEAIAILNEHFDSYYFENAPDGKVHNLLGNLYLAIENIGDAVKHYYAALGKEPENEEYGLNLAETFYKLKDYASAYKLTSQIVQKDKLDRAKSLHLRVTSHLFVTINCGKCKRGWSFKKGARGNGFDERRVPDLPAEAPAGTCPSCGKTFCRSCVPGVPGVETICPDCKVTLDFNSESLKIIGTQLLERDKS